MFLIVLSILPNVLAIGITPGRTTIDFSPNAHDSIKFKVINSEHKDMKVVMRIEGELAQYITLPQLIFDLNSNEESKEFSYEYTLPSKIETPGSHEAQIIAQELPKDAEKTGAFVGATPAVATQLLVKVPYPGKYAEIRLDISEARVNETTKFIIPVLNFGTEPIQKAKATIEILGPTNERIALIETDEKSINAKETKELIAQWTANVNAGAYHAIAVLTYDGKLARAEKNFNVGDLAIDILNIDVKNFQLGGVAKFDILVENKWNTEIDNVYAQFNVVDENNNEIGSFKSTSSNIPAFSKSSLIAYWDTTGINSGFYNTKLSLNYAGKSTDKIIKTEITMNSIKMNILGQAIASESKVSRDAILTIFIIVLIVINILWFVYFKRKKQKDL